MYNVIPRANRQRLYIYIILIDIYNVIPRAKSPKSFWTVNYRQYATIRHGCE